MRQQTHIGLEQVEFRLTVTISEHGYDPDNGESFLDGFLQTHPEAGPVVSQNTETGHLTITFSVIAADVLDATRRGADLFVAGANASGLPATDVVEATIHVTQRPPRRRDAAARNDRWELAGVS